MYRYMHLGLDGWLRSRSRSSTTDRNYSSTWLHRSAEHRCGYTMNTDHNKRRLTSPLSLVAPASVLQPIYSSSCSQQPGSRAGTLSACTTGTDDASGAACAIWIALRFNLADVAPSGACADSLMNLESSAAVRRRRSRRPCPAGPGMRQGRPRSIDGV